MKKTFKLQGIAAIIAVIVMALAFAACGNGDNEDGSETTYTITFNRNNTLVGGARPSGAPPSSRTVEAGSSITLPDRGGMSHRDAVFDSWNTKDDGTGEKYNAGAEFTPTGNTTLYAIWRAGCYVDFNLNGGIGDAPQTVTTTYGSSVGMPYGNGFSRFGYTFAGWRWENRADTALYQPGSYDFTVSGHCTMYAVWTLADGYRLVTYNVNGGIWNEAPNSQPVESGSVISLLDNNSPTKDNPDRDRLYRSGYIFSGWNTSADGMGTNFSAGEIYTVNSSITLYAKWIANGIDICTVTYSLNGGNGTTPSVQVVVPNSVVTFNSGSGLSKTNCTFGGWNTSADGTGTNYTAGSSYTVNSNIILYADWIVTTYTITFNANRGSGTVPVSRTVEPGYGISLPDSGNLSLAYAAFTGWSANADGSGAYYTANSPYTPTGNIPNIILYARWDITPLSSVTGIVNKLAWIQAHAQSGAEYIIEVDADESISPQTLYYSGRSNITVTLKSSGFDVTDSSYSNIGKIVSLSSNGAMFTVNSGVTLVLDMGIVLEGRSNNTNSLVRVNSGGKLLMSDKSRITGNVNSNGNGGGVYVNDGTFTMAGGGIYYNTANNGGGVYVGDNGTFSSGDGIIYENIANNGGGVYIGNKGIFKASSVLIERNIASSNGGGVYVGDNGTFTMASGGIYYNTANNGGGVYIGYNGHFTITTFQREDYGYSFIQTSIDGNTASNSGGGVYVGSSGTFTIPIHEFYSIYDSYIAVSSNTAGSSGGGVYVDRGTFIKSCGIIGYFDRHNIYYRGDNNVVKDTDGNVLSNRGHQVYAWDGSSATRRETTAGEDVDLSFRDGMFSGEWEF